MGHLSAALAKGYSACRGGGARGRLDKGRVRPLHNLSAALQRQQP